ncbi:MAG: pyridoxal phosphate-dependent aminotransferase [Deltaproteobacteria bacterium]|nr:pyridoxal phosphate-dependent aminotransferase [Deltaproteobacteria bacterium]
MGGLSKAKFDFDELIPRKGTNCIKYDWAKERGFPDDVLPMWVADMDFRTAGEIIEALEKSARYGIFGYTEVGPSYFDPIGDWFQRRFGYQLRPDWMLKTPGVVFALNMCVRAYTREGDNVLIQSPVYHPFHSSVTENGRKILDNTLIYKDGAYSVDLADFERKIVDGKVGLFLLCSPHNPVARVWTEEELSAMGAICLKHGCVVAADEIHCDFVWGERNHRLFPSVGHAFERNAVLLTAPSKTFNLAGLNTSNVFIPDPSLRQRFRDEVSRTGVSQLQVMGLVACEAAYRHGEPWFDALKGYLEGNIAYVESFFRERLAPLSLAETQGTYLMWADFSGLKLPHKTLSKLLSQKARLWLSDGLTFGEAGKEFRRINVATPRKNVEEAMGRLAGMLESL